MSHDAPVNTVPTLSAITQAPKPAMIIVFDVGSLDRTETFYNQTLGFTSISTERAGLPYESRVLRSPEFPSVSLVARKSYRRSVTGSTSGGVIQIGLYDTKFADRMARLGSSVTWIRPLPKDEPERSAAWCASFLDPDGYVVELYR